jgi:RNA polymerase sigma-70 factor (ECF subfamily)
MALSPSLPTDSDPEHDLMVRARAGESEALDVLVRRHRRELYLLAVQLLGDREEAMDATQDALLRFITSLSRFRLGDPLRPWLFTIVRNRCRDLQRRRAVRKTDSLDAGDDDIFVAEPVCDRPSPEETLLERRRQREVWRGLRLLPESQREILVLRDYQDLSYQEIADQLDVPIGTVMSRLHRARKALAEHLSSAGGPGRARA